MTKVRLTLYSSKALMFLSAIACKTFGQHTTTPTCLTMLFTQTPCVPYKKFQKSFRTTTKSTALQNRTGRSLGNALRLTTWTQRPRLYKLAVRVIGHGYLPYCISAHTVYEWQLSVQIQHRHRRCPRSLRLNAMFVTMLHTPHQSVRFLSKDTSKEIAIARSQNEKRPTDARSRSSDKRFLTVQSAHKENTTIIATIVLSTNLLYLIVIRASSGWNW